MRICSSNVCDSICIFQLNWTSASDSQTISPNLELAIPRLQTIDLLGVLQSFPGIKAAAFVGL